MLCAKAGEQISTGDVIQILYCSRCGSGIAIRHRCVHDSDVCGFLCPTCRGEDETVEKKDEDDVVCASPILLTD